MNLQQEHIISFEKAALNLGCNTQNLEIGNSSVQKGETLYDTVKLFESLGCDVVVIRHTQNRYYDDLIGKVNIPILSGGRWNWRSIQANRYLDLLTIRQEFGHFKGLKVAIVGDVKHSRVAHSNFKSDETFRYGSLYNRS